MRYLLLFWAGPMGFFWGWYFLSLNDISMGTRFFSRELHDLVFTIYGNILHLEPEAIPALVARACVFDTFLILGIFAFRRRRVILSWVRSMKSTAQSDAAAREIA